MAMEYRRLGSTGLKVSRLALGCGNFGGIGSARLVHEDAVVLRDRRRERRNVGLVGRLKVAEAEVDRREKRRQTAEQGTD